MAKFKKALALVLSLAMVLTLAPIANVQTKAAAKYKIKAATTAIAAGKTYNVKVTGVAKTQYVKVARSAGVTVKYNSKTIKASKKVVGTGKTLTFKVTVPDKVANYKSTIKAVIYNKKTNKKVKTLSTKRTVKVTALEVSKVEPTSTTGKYLTAYFTKAVDSLKVADVTIQETATGIKKGVESVTLSSDGKSANISLVGSESGANEFVERLVEYTFSVTKNGATASTKFIVDDMRDNAVVTAIDGVNRTITVNNPVKATMATVTVPESIAKDLEELYGQTVSVWFNKENVVTKLVKVDEKTILGSFDGYVDATTGKRYLVDAITLTKYPIETTTAGNIYPTQMITRVGTALPAAGAIANNTHIDYAKVVLNSTGTIRSVVGIGNWTSNFLVQKVDGHNIVNGGVQLSLQNFTIVKDGKSVELSSIAEGDVVYYHSAGKYAEVYSEKKTGPLTGVYSTGFGFDGKTYNFTNDGTPVRRLKGSGFTTIDADYMNSLLAGKADITVYYNRAGKPVFVSGTAGDVKTTSVTLISTEKANAFHQSLKDYIHVSGYNTSTKKVENYDIDITKLTSLTNNYGVKFAVGSKTDKDSTVRKMNQKVTGFVAAAPFTSAQNAGSTQIDANVVSDAGVAGTEEDILQIQAKAAGYVVAGGANNGNISADIDDSEEITLTLDESNTVIGLSFAQGQKLATMNGKAVGTTAFAAGYTTINGLSVTASTPVYLADRRDKSVTATTYGAFTGSVTAANANEDEITVYASGSSVGSIVIDKAALVVAGRLAEVSNDGIPYVAIVQNYKLSSDGKSVQVFDFKVGSEDRTLADYTVKAGVVGPATLALGDVVIVTPDKSNAKQINAISATQAKYTGAFTIGSDGTSFTITKSDGSRTFSVRDDVTMAKIGTKTDGPENTLITVGINDIQALKREVSVVQYNDNASQAWAVVVETAGVTDAKATLKAAAEDAIDTYNDNAPAAVDTKAEQTLAQWASLNTAQAVGTYSNRKAADAQIAAYVAAGYSADEISGYTAYKAIIDEFDKNEIGSHLVIALVVNSIEDAATVPSNGETYATDAVNNHKASEVQTFCDGKIEARQNQTYKMLDGTTEVARSGAWTETWTLTDHSVDTVAAGSTRTFELTCALTGVNVAGGTYSKTADAAGSATITVKNGTAVNAIIDNDDI